MKISKRAIYDYLPEVAKDGLGWALRLMPRFRWQPTPEERAYYAHLQECEQLCVDELKSLQLQKLSRLLVYAYQHVPYYRRIFDGKGMKPQDIQALKDLQELPLLTKDIIRANPADFISDEFPDRKGLTEVTTGGSTGTPMRFYFDDHMVGVQRAHWWRWSQFAGIDLYRDRMVFCGGSQANWIYDPADSHGVINYERNRLSLLSALMTDKVLDNYIDDIRDFRGDYIRGYASGLYMLGTRLLAKGNVLPMKAILTSSDALYSRYRSVIEKAFSCKVYDHYGQNEDVLTATDCTHTKGLHINMESCVAETVDAQGEVLGQGDGRLVGTHLENRAMPLIRYVVGDWGELDCSGERCECGRYHQKLLSVTGRDDEVLVTPDGRRIHCIALDPPLESMQFLIKKCQYIQESLDLLTIKVVPTAQWREPTNREELISHTRRQLGNSIQIEVLLVDDIPPRSNGKYQFIVSKLSKAMTQV